VLISTGTVPPRMRVWSRVWRGAVNGVELCMLVFTQQLALISRK